MKGACTIHKKWNTFRYSAGARTVIILRGPVTSDKVDIAIYLKILVTVKVRVGHGGLKSSLRERYRDFGGVGKRVGRSQGGRTEVMSYKADSVDSLTRSPMSHGLNIEIR